MVCRDFIPVRAVRCQFGFVAADSHTFLLLKDKQNKINERTKSLLANIIKLQSSHDYQQRISLELNNFFH